MKNKAAAAAAGPESEYGRSNQLLLNHHATITVIVSSFLLLSAVVDSFRFGAVWILSTRRLSDVRFVFHCSGFSPLRSRVHSSHDTWIPTQRHTVVIVIVVVMDIISAQAWQKQDKHYSCTRSHRSLATR